MFIELSLVVFLTRYNVFALFHSLTPIEVFVIITQRKTVS